MDQNEKTLKKYAHFDFTIDGENDIITDELLHIIGSYLKSHGIDIGGGVTYVMVDESNDEEGGSDEQER